MHEEDLPWNYLFAIEFSLINTNTDQEKQWNPYFEFVNYND